MSKKKVKTLIMYCFIILAVLLMGLSTTLAVLKDVNNKDDNDLKFGKVAIATHSESEGGSSLQLKLLNDTVTRNSEIINVSEDIFESNFYFNIGENSEDMFVRFKIFFTFGSEDIDSLEEESQVLALLNAGDGIPAGMELYHYVDGDTEKGLLDYEYVAHEGWYYVATIDNLESNATDRYLKEVTQESGHFTIARKYILTYNESDEAQILRVVKSHEGIMLKVQVEAIQCEGLENAVGDIPFDSNASEDILISEAVGLGGKYGITIGQYSKAIIENEIAEQEKNQPEEEIPEDEEPEIIRTTLISSAEEFIGDSTETDTDILLEMVEKNSPLEIGFLGSMNENRGGNALLSRGLISSLEFTGYDPINSISGVLNDDYFIVDSGVEENQIFSYWIKNSEEIDIEGELYNTYSLIVYQEGGVNFNPISDFMFAKVGFYCMTDFNMLQWDINATNITSCFAMFYQLGMETLNNFVLSEKLNTSNVRNMEYMFAYVGFLNLENFELGSNFTTENALSLNGMFYSIGMESYNFYKLDLSNYDFSNANVTNFANMFYGCGFNSLNSLILGDEFGTDKVTNMASMFAICGWNNLDTLDLGKKFNTTNVTDMNYMFSGCGHEKLTTLDLSIYNFSTENVEDMSFMFSDIYAVTTFNLGDKFNTIKVKNMQGMFANFAYNSLTSLSLRPYNFDTSNVTNMESMFGSCGYKSMISLDLGETFYTYNVENMKSMFSNCGKQSMTSLDLGENFNTINVKNMSYMFSNCGYNSMITLTLGSDFNTNKVQNMSYMFYKCGYTKMSNLNLGNCLQNLSSLTNSEYMFYNCATSTCYVTVASEYVRQWLINNKTKIGSRNWMSTTYISIA